MGKRQKRFTGEDLASEEIVGKEANVVKKDGTIFHIKILSLNSDHLIGEDLRKKKYKFALKEVYEIILDLVSAY
jgi:hypothetical protein